MSVIDLNTYNSLKEVTGEDFINELVATFLEDTTSLIAQAKSALAAKDADAFRRSAHTIKSNAATFGAMQLAEMAREMESMGREKNFEIGNRLRALEEAFEQVKNKLKELG